MLLVLLAIFLECNVGQTQYGYEEQVITHDFTNEANVHEVDHEASVRAVESAPPKIRYDISHEAMQLEPIPTDVSTISEIIQENQDVASRRSVSEFNHEGSVNVINAATLLPKVQLNREQETIKLEPKVSKVFSPTISESTEEGNQDVASRMSLNGIHHEESMNVINAAASLPKVQLNAEETIKLKPKISNVFSHAISKFTQEENQQIAGKTHIRVINEADLFAGESTNLINIAAPSPKIQFDIKHDTIEFKPRISNVFSQTFDEITRGANQDIADRTSVSGINHEESVNVISATPLSRVQLNMEQETIKLEPKISNVFSHTMSEMTQEENQQFAGRTLSHQGIEGANHYVGGSMNIMIKNLLNRRLGDNKANLHLYF